MMTKTKSKQSKQVKYLLLVPVLASMLLYTACSNNDQPKGEFNKVQSRTVEEIPFSSLDKVPAFPNQGEGKEAFTKNMMQFVMENFNSKLANTLGLEPGKKRIFVQFKIDKEGNVIDINARAPHPKLKEEAERMITKLPQFVSGEHNGKKVTVRYTLPITFVVE